MNAVGPDEAVRRLRWRCRRGAKELDLLLLRYLERVYPLATAAEQAGFERLLEAQDPDLAAWLYGRSACPDPELATLVAAIRSLGALSG